MQLILFGAKTPSNLEKTAARSSASSTKGISVSQYLGINEGYFTMFTSMRIQAWKISSSVLEARVVMSLTISLLRRSGLIFSFSAIDLKLKM